MFERRPHRRNTYTLHIGDRVRIRPTGRQKHYGRGVIVELHGDKAVVQIFPRHRHPEAILVSALVPWKSGNAQTARIAANRGQA